MIPQTFTVTSEHPFLRYSFSVLHFLVVVSVRWIKLTRVGFRAHVKLASRIVSYRVNGQKTFGRDYGADAGPKRGDLQTPCVRRSTTAKETFCPFALSRTSGCPDIHT